MFFTPPSSLSPNSCARFLSYGVKRLSVVFHSIGFKTFINFFFILSVWNVLSANTSFPRTSSVINPSNVLLSICARICGRLSGCLCLVSTIWILIAIGWLVDKEPVLLISWVPFLVELWIFDEVGNWLVRVGIHARSNYRLKFGRGGVVISNTSDW